MSHQGQGCVEEVYLREALNPVELFIQPYEYILILDFQY